MSLISMPLVVVNIGAEMIYVLDQRLKAQCIAEDKAFKVLDEVVCTWFDNQFIEELFKPQEIYSLTSVRQIFERLAHSSIMRLSTASTEESLYVATLLPFQKMLQHMDKLYDLMVMGLKYQLLCCCQTSELLQVILMTLTGPMQVTLLHLSTVKQLLRSALAKHAVDVVEARVRSLYDSLPQGQWALLRQTLAGFLLGKRVKVSLFLQEGIQTPDGRVILHAPDSNEHTPPVGSVMTYAQSGTVQSRQLSLAATQGNPADFFQHPAPLGSNLYDRDRLRAQIPAGRGVALSNQDTQAEAAAALAAAEAQEAAADKRQEGASQEPAPPGAGLHELNMLARLIKQPKAQQASNFKLNLFASSPQPAGLTAKVQVRTQTFGHAGKNEAYRDQAKELAHVMTDVASVPDGGDAGDDLLDLMDNANLL